jgi:hypothetical protein
LQNCTLELATLGDLKLVEKPQPVVLAPRDFCNIKANVKVASTENGIIFGNIGEHCYFTTLFPVVPYKFCLCKSYILKVLLQKTKVIGLKENYIYKILH